MSGRSTLRGVAAAGGLVGLGAGLVAAGRAGRSVTALRARRAAARHAVPADVGVSAHDVTLTSAVGSRLHGWWVPAGDEPGPAVLVLHGYASHAGDMLPVAPQLHAAGIHALLLDVRGHGRSAPVDETPRPPQFAEDATAALDWLAGREDVTSVGVLGHSMGGSVAIAAAAGDGRIGAVLAVAAVASPLLTRIGWWPAALSRVLLSTLGRRRGIDPSRTFAVNRIADVTAPVMLLHGDRDRIVPIAHLHALSTARPDATVAVVSGAGHSSFEAFAPAMPDALRFLSEALTS